MANSRSGIQIRSSSGAAGGAPAGRSEGVELYTLGSVRLVRAGEDLTASVGARRLALLVYLFHEARPLSPGEIIELLGRSSSEEKEMEGLQRAVAWLRENLSGVYIKVSAETVEAVRGVWLDTREVDAAIDGRDPDCISELYRGDFLDGFNSGSSAFDEWAGKERGRIRRAWTNAILSQARGAEGAGVWHRAATWWRILVSRAPTRPEGVAGLLRSLAMAHEDLEASLAYRDYMLSLRQNGNHEPANQVSEVVREYSITEVAPDDNAAAPSPSPPPPLQAEFAPEPEFETELTQGAEASIEEAVSILREEIEAPENDDGFEMSSAIEEAATDSGIDVDVSAPVEALTGLEANEGPLADHSAPSVDTAPELDPGLLEEPTEREAEDIEAIAGLETNEIAVAKAKVEAAPPREHEIQSEAAELELPPEEASAEAVEVPSEAFESALEKLIDAPEPPAAEPEKSDQPAESPGDVPQESARTPGADILPQEFGPPKPQRQDEAWDEIVDYATPDEPEVDLKGLDASGTAARTRAGSLDDDFLDPDSLGRADDSEPAGRRSARRRLSGYLPSRPRLGESSVGSGVGGLLVRAVRTAFVLLFRVLVAAGRGSLWLVKRVVGSGTRQEKGQKLELADAYASRKRSPLAAMGETLAGLRRFWYLPLGVALTAAALLAYPMLAARLGGSAPGLSRPSVSLPRFSVPKVTVKTPGFVTSGINKIAEMLSGPILEDMGARIVVADVSSSGSDRRALSAALRADLSQATYFSTPLKEQVLLMLGGEADWALSEATALGLARAQSFDLVISGKIVGGSDSLVIRVLTPAGEELHRAAQAIAAGTDLLDPMHALVGRVRRRLGESRDAIEKSRPPNVTLSHSLDAIGHYDEAIEFFFRGRIDQAISAAQRSLDLDPDFASAHLLLARLFGQQRRRELVAAELERAWDLRERLSERDELRVSADRFAVQRQYSDAAYAYDRVFSAYRDDVAALKSQALMQRSIGARGGGLGNLQVAYTIAPVDWPRLDHIARYLAYDGPALPNVDSLIASAASSN